MNPRTDRFPSDEKTPSRVKTKRIFVYIYNVYYVQCVSIVFTARRGSNFLTVTRICYYNFFPSRTGEDDMYGRYALWVDRVKRITIR